MTIRVCVLAHGEGLPLPAQQTEHSAGMDLRAAITEPIELSPGRRIQVPSGIMLEIPTGWEAQARPRSGLAIRHGITLLNAPGTIDADYRGEVAVILVNLGDEPFMIRRGDRIAQLVIAPLASVEMVRTETLSTSDRGEGGFGSTGP